MNEPHGPSGGHGPFFPVPPTGHPMAGPAPAPPYGFPHPPGHPGPRHKTSGLAIAALVLGLIGCLPLSVVPAIILGIVALTQTGPGKRPGRGLAIGGLAAAGVWTVGWVALLGNTLANPNHFTANPPSQGCAAPSPGYANVCTLKPGDCFEQAAIDVTFTSIELSACGGTHSSEVVGAFIAQDGPWPGEEKLKADASTQCERIVAKNVDNPRLDAVDGDVYLSHAASDRVGWEHGVRTVLCTIYAPGSKLTGSLLAPGADLAIPTG
ncbi:septum formation family protein [Amycolatopsis sp. NPDC051071]|uniref:DUF4190 domain-containing protein n=1 Tax=Amycolatopsis sp. NPDC051071 TaxID=3154637 RepID=UPI0034219604